MIVVQESVSLKPKLFLTNMVKVFIGISFVLIGVFSCNNRKHQDTALFIDLRTDTVIPKHYIITKSSEHIFIDGKADEAVWQSAVFSDYFVDIEGVEKPEYDTRFKMLWDEKYLYLYVEMEEPHIWANLKQRDTVIFFNNDFEVFIDPSGTTKNYAEIEINALGTVWDLLMDRPYYRSGRANNHWNLDALKATIKVYGSLNNPHDIDSLWAIEMAIPMDALTELRNSHGILLEEGELWRINFLRVEWDFDIIDGIYYRKKINGDFLENYNWVWSSQKVMKMHEPEKWGYLQFTHESSAENIAIVKDENMLIKQVLYALMRQTGYGSLQNLQKQKAGYIKNINVQFSDTDTLKAVFYKTNYGFEFTIKDKQSGKTFVINEGGMLKTIK